MQEGAFSPGSEYTEAHGTREPINLQERREKEAAEKLSPTEFYMKAYEDYKEKTPAEWLDQLRIAAHPLREQFLEKAPGLWETFYKTAGLIAKAHPLLNPYTLVEANMRDFHGLDSYSDEYQRYLADYTQEIATYVALEGFASPKPEASEPHRRYHTFVEPLQATGFLNSDYLNPQTRIVNARLRNTLNSLLDMGDMYRDVLSQLPAQPATPTVPHALAGD